jgi:polar amino acid transport system substrate-binding protein
MAKRWILLVSLLALLVSSGCSTLGWGTRSPVIDRIRKTGELRVGMTGDYPPLNVLDRSGRNIGLEPDLARALAASLDVELVVVNKPFAELLPSLQAGEVDAILSGMTMTPERNLDVAFVGPYFISGKALLTRSDQLARSQSAGELDRSTISLAALEGTTSQTFVEKAMPTAKLVTARDYDEAVQMVIDRRVDGLIADYPVCVVRALRNRGAGLSTVAAPLTFEPIGIALPANDALFVNLVDNYLKSLEGTGLLTQLRAKWFEDASWVRQLP